jgi:histidine triad (HIT) family protein
VSDSASNPDCLFCRIVTGAVPSRRVYEDERALAFLDLSAWHRGHTLVIPKRHAASLVSGPSLMADIAPAIDATARLLVDRLAADGLNLVSSAGEAAGQTVFHLHVHLVPRYADRPGLPYLVDHGDVGAGELDAVQAQILKGP